MSYLLPQDQVYWYLNDTNITPLRDSIETDVVVIGGGMAGLSAAQSFREKGKEVVLLEKNFCGAGASGKSSGFITPNSELSLSDLEGFYGIEEAKRIWEFVMSGVTHISTNITQNNLACDYQPQDTLVLANSERAFKKIIMPEYKVREKLGYPSTLYHSSQDLSGTINSHNYSGAISYGQSFGIQGYHYCQGMKNVLLQQGVAVYEETPALEIRDHLVVTPYATVKAKHIIVCLDQFLSYFKKLSYQLYHAQTFLMVSEELTQQQVEQIFPEKKYMAWDTDMIYHYFRLTGENRLLMGGADIFTTYASRENHHNTGSLNTLKKYVAAKFPTLKLTFEYSWPGLIGISKDLMPLAGHDKEMPSVYYIAASTGLPWAAALGRYSAESILENNHGFDDYFSPYRNFTLGPITQNILGTKITFALSNLMRSGSF